MIIKREKYKNQDAIILETNILRVVVFPEIGFKLASIYHKNKEFELLSQSKNNRYIKPKFSDMFMRYDESGANDIIPTLEKCEYPDGLLKGTKLHDRGDAWSLPWDVELNNDSIIGEVYLKTLPLKLKKSIELQDNRIIMNYELKNLSKTEVKYLWTFQSLNSINDEVEFIFQDDMKNIVNTRSNEDLTRLDLNKLKSYRDDRIYRYFFWGKFKKGEIGLRYKDKKINYIMNYDIDKIPYIGVWVDKRKNRAAVEPTNSFFDSVSVANDNSMVRKIDGMDTDVWDMEIMIEDY